MNCTAWGFNAEAIAEQLKLSIAAVRWHLLHIRGELHLKRSVQLFATGVEMSLPQGTALKFNENGWKVFTLRLQGLTREEIAGQFEKMSLEGVRYHLRKMCADNDCETFAELATKVRKEMG